MNTIDLNDVRNMLPHARAIAQGGLLYSAGDDGIIALASAHVNFENRNSAWCACLEPGEQVYYANLDGSQHGWLCDKCHGITQTG